MKTFRIILIALLLSAIGATAAEYVTAVLTITNQPSTYGLKYTVNGNVRTGTNAQTSATWTTNTTFAGTATNIFNQLALGGVGSGVIQSISYSNVTFQGVGLTASIDAGLGKFVLSTQTIANAYSVIVPFDVLSATNRTNNADALVYGIGRYSLSEAIPAASRALTNFVNQGLSQSVSNKAFTHSVATNLVIVTGIASNMTAIGGQVAGLTNGWITGTKLTNVSLNATSGISSGLTIISSTISNSSFPGVGTSTLQIGASAKATNNYASAVGDSSIAAGYASVSLGLSSQTHSNYGIAIGAASVSYGIYGISVGAGARTDGYKSIAIGSTKNVTSGNGIDGNYVGSLGFNNQLGPSASSNVLIFANGFQIASGGTAETNRIFIGNGIENIALGGNVSAASYTNAALTGTNIFSAFGLVRTNNSGLANGDNAGISLGAHSYVKLSGPTAAFGIVGIDGGYDGRIVTLQKVDGFTCTVKNDSGVEPTAANRIYTGTGADVTFTNNPGIVSLIYDGATSRWVIIQKSN